MKTSDTGGATADSSDPWASLGTRVLIWEGLCCSFLGTAQGTRALVCSWVCQSFDTVPSKKPLNLLTELASSGSLPAFPPEGWLEGTGTGRMNLS